MRIVVVHSVHNVRVRIQHRILAQCLQFDAYRCWLLLHQAEFPLAGNSLVLQHDLHSPRTVLVASFVQFVNVVSSRTFAYCRKRPDALDEARTVLVAQLELVHLLQALQMCQGCRARFQR